MVDKTFLVNVINADTSSFGNYNSLLLESTKVRFPTKKGKILINTEYVQKQVITKAIKKIFGPHSFLFKDQYKSYGSIVKAGKNNYEIIYPSVKLVVIML